MLTATVRDQAIEVEYRLSQPASRLALRLPVQGEARESSWELLPGPGGRRPALERTGDRDVLVAPEPTAVFRARLALPEAGRAELWVRAGARYLDVGLLLPEAERDVEVRVASEGWILGAGRASRKLLELAPGDVALLESTPVYLGTREPVDYGDFHLVVSPELPAWLADSAHAYLPRVYGALSARAGGPVAWKPLVALEYAPSPDASLAEVTPGGQGGLLELTVRGGAWDVESEGATVTWIWSLAHDLVHIWNQEAYRPAFPDEDEWLLEGAADALALQALQAVSLIPKDEAADYLGERLRACAGALTVPLTEAQGALASDCGVAAWTAAEAAVARRLGPDRASRALFTGLLDRADPEYRYTRYGFLEAVRHLGGDAAVTRHLARLLELGTGESAGEALRELLSAVGLEGHLRAPAGGTR